MAKLIPEINISSFDQNSVSNDLLSDLQSEGATDCEVLENFQPKSGAKFKEILKPRKCSDVFLTDVEASSEDDTETLMDYPKDCINSFFDIGMNCEEVINSQGPNKSQRSITCSLESKFKPHFINECKFDDGATDLEGLMTSDDDDDIISSSGIHEITTDVAEGNGCVSVIEKMVTSSAPSPAVTPEPRVASRNKMSNNYCLKGNKLKVMATPSGTLTDVEILSDVEQNSNRKPKKFSTYRHKPSWNMSASDSEDSDVAPTHIRANKTVNKKMGASRSFDNFKTSLKQQTLIIKQENKMEATTDTEIIEVDNKSKSKVVSTRPSVIQRPKSCTTMCQDIKMKQKIVGVKKNNAFKSSHHSNPTKQTVKQTKSTNLDVKLTLEEYLTDIEAFESDEEAYFDDSKPVAYLPDSTRELILCNENHKGGVSLIIPIKESSKYKGLELDNHDCGYSDVEDIPGYEVEEFVRYPTPDLPRNESSVIQNSESMIDYSKLVVAVDLQESVTDTEEISFNDAKKTGKQNLKSKSGNHKLTPTAFTFSKLSDCGTDVEELIESDYETKEHQLCPVTNPLPTTDIDDLTADEDEFYTYGAITPDIQTSSTYVTEKEGLSPFSNEVKRQMNNSIPKIQTTSPSPIPFNTDVEDCVGSQDDCIESNNSSEGETVEDHASVIHIKHTRKFQTEGEESAHIKGNYIIHEPVTDVEEIRLPENSNKRKMCHKRKDTEDSSIKICFTGSKGGNSCKWRSKNHVKCGERQTESTKTAINKQKTINSSMQSDINSSWPKLSCRSSYDNLNGIFYTDLYDETVYPPQLGYAEFQGEAPFYKSDFENSSVSLVFDTGTESFSELLFSSSNSESESPDESVSKIQGAETCGILYKLSEQIDRVPLMLHTQKREEIQSQNYLERQSSLENRLTVYLKETEYSNVENSILSDTDNLELKKLEDTIDHMLSDIKKEEELFSSNHPCGDEQAVKINTPSSEQDSLENRIVLTSEICNSNDALSSLNAIEHHITKLLKDVDEDSNNFMILCDNIQNQADNGFGCTRMRGIDYSSPDEDHLHFRESSYTPSPVDSCSTSEDEYEVDAPKVQLKVGRKYGKSTINISVKNSKLNKNRITNIASYKYFNRSLPSLSSSSLSLPLKEHNSVESILSTENLSCDYRKSSKEYIIPKPGLDMTNSGYCIWTMPNEDEVIEYGSDINQTQEGIAANKTTPIEDYSSTFEFTRITTESNTKLDYDKSQSASSSTDNRQVEAKELNMKKSYDYFPKTKQENVSVSETLPHEESKLLNDNFEKTTKKVDERDINNFSDENICLDPSKRSFVAEDINYSYDYSDEENEFESKPYITTPNQSRRNIGIGGSQRLPRGERPTVRVVTDYLEDSESDVDEDNYIVTEPYERPKGKRNVKIRFSPDLYDKDGEKSSVKITEETEVSEVKDISFDNGPVDKVEFTPINVSSKNTGIKNIEKVERRFERMASESKEADPSENAITDGEFQKFVSQLSLEEVNEALHQWDAGGLTPSDIDSKDITVSSEELSPILQESSHTLEPEEQGEMAPTPYPRAPVKPKEKPMSPKSPTQKEPTEEDSQTYAKKKIFWEQISASSTETAIEQEPPVPKPRTSLTSNTILSEVKKGIDSCYSDASSKLEASDIDVDSPETQGTLTTEKVAFGITKEHSLSLDGEPNSEIEYIKSHKVEEMSYENPAFKLDETDEDKSFVSKSKKPIYERSVSLPCDSSLDTNNVRTKKRIFEAQIKKEMVVEQLMAQLEEESSPEHKSIEQKTKMPATNAQAMVTRQIHSDIFSNELEEQIEFHVPEKKELIQEKIPDLPKDTETVVESGERSESDIRSNDFSVEFQSDLFNTNNLSNNVAEVLQYKNELISKPSDSLEVHVDKSELEDTEKDKDIDEDLNITDEVVFVPVAQITDQIKVSSITSSQGESEDTFSESDVTPEETRYKEQQEINEWPLPDKESKLTISSTEDSKKQRNVYTPEEHIPDTVWEVPVQEEIESIQEEIVQIPNIPKDKEFGPVKSEAVLTESEAREIAENVVDEIETKLSKHDEMVQIIKQQEGELTDLIIDAKKSIDISETHSKQSPHLKFVRTDTTTSSVEITDEDLRSSGVETDNSPLESQASRLIPLDHSQGDSSDDIDNQELDHDCFGKEVVEKTLAEVKQSLEAVKEELIEEKKKKKDSITKESPSEFEFKMVSLENTFNESIQECHQEESAIASYKRKTDLKVKVEDLVTKQEIFTSTEDKSESSLKEEIKNVKENIIFELSNAKGETSKKRTSQVESSKTTLSDRIFEKDSSNKTFAKATKCEDIVESFTKIQEEKVKDVISSKTDRTVSEMKDTKISSTSREKLEELKEARVETVELLEEFVTEMSGPGGSTVEKRKDQTVLKSEESQSSSLKESSSEDITTKVEKIDKPVMAEESKLREKITFEKTENLERESVGETEKVSILTDEDKHKQKMFKQEDDKLEESAILPHPKVSFAPIDKEIVDEPLVKEVFEQEKIELSIESHDTTNKLIGSKLDEADSGNSATDIDGQMSRQEERKSSLQEDAGSTSSSSEPKAESDDLGTDVIVRKHKKTHIKLKQDHRSDGELYSSSGESHYQSFEQTSESIKTPGSRPLSSDIEGLVANLGGITGGSSEYESAVSHEISGHSTTATSKEFHTAVSSLSSRDSMKSLDSESSGNLASVEVSSEASETLVPSAMELENDMETESSVPKTEKPIHFKIDEHVKMQSFSESIEQSVSFDISGEDISEDEDDVRMIENETSQRMKRSHEMTFQPEPRPITDSEGAKNLQGKTSASADDINSGISSSETGVVYTVLELSKTESERMDSSATSEQLSLTVSGTSEILNISESTDLHVTTSTDTKTETISTQSPSMDQSHVLDSVTITSSSITEHGIQSVCTQVTSKASSKSSSQSNGPTQVEYNAEYDGEPEVKKKGHRRNGSTSFRPSMIPVFQYKDSEKKKSEDIAEDAAESDKYSRSLTQKEGSREEKKDVDEAERLEEESYQTEADQGLHRDIREGRVILEDNYTLEESKDYEFDFTIKSRLSSAAFSDDHPDSELAELLKQCSTDLTTEDPIERPRTPEPLEECELKDDTPEFSSEAQASVTELEIEYSGAFSRTSEYQAHVSPIREKGMLPYESWEEVPDHDQEVAEASSQPGSSSKDVHSKQIPEDLHAEKNELGIQELALKDETLESYEMRTSPVPNITVTQHMTPSLKDSFDRSDTSEPPLTPQPSSAIPDEEMIVQKRAGDTRELFSYSAEKMDDDEIITGLREDAKDQESTTDSPTSDSFELLEKPDLADEFVIIEEVGKEAQEQDTEGKGVRIEQRRIAPRPQVQGSNDEIVSPPTTSTKMTQLKYYSSGGNEEDILFDFDSGSPSNKGVTEDKVEESSFEGSPPSAAEQDFKPEVEASKKWIEMQFQGEPVAPIYGYEIEFERGGPLEDIKEEDINDLESSSKIGSMGSQVSHSIGSFGSVKESLSSTPDYDILAGRRFFTRSGEHDDVSMSSLQEFERLENLIALESTKHRSLGSQDSLTSSSNSRKHGKSGGDDISLASLKEFEGLESACIAAEKIEKKAKAEEESLLSEIEEGHESQASESESCATISVGMNRAESDEDDYERRMFEIDEIIRQAQTNVENFMGVQKKDLLESALKCETLGRADSLEEIAKVPDLDLDQPIQSVSYSSGKSYIQHWEELGDDLLTSTDSLEVKTQISKTSIADPFTTSTDSLELKMTHDMMSVSTDSIETSHKHKKKDIMTDSIEVGEKSSMITSTDSLEGKVTQANSIDDDEHHNASGLDQSSSSGKEGDLSSSGREDSAEGAVGMTTNRMPPPRAEFLLGSTDSLEPTSSTATHATYQYETDSVMSSSFTSGDSTTMVDDNDDERARASYWFEEGKPYVTEVIEPIVGDDEFPQMIHRTVEMPPQIHKITFKGDDSEKGLRDYIERFDPGEDVTETREVDKDGNVHIKRVIQKRVVIRPEELGGETTDLKGPELEKYLRSLTDTDIGSVSPLLESVYSSSPIESRTVTTIHQTTTTSQTKGETIETDQQQKGREALHRGSRPPLKYDISVDEEPEFDPREHDWRFNLHTHVEGEEDLQELASGYTLPSSGVSKPSEKSMKK